MTEMPYLMESFGSTITNFNKDIRSIGTYLCAHGEDTGNLLPHLVATYADYGSDNVPFTCYIEILGND